MYAYDYTHIHVFLHFVSGLEQEIPLDLTLHHQTSREHPDLSDVEEEEEGNCNEEDLSQLEKQLEGLQKRFDVSMMEKHSLSSMCQDLTIRVRLATSLLDGLV